MQELQNYQPINITTLEDSISGNIPDDIKNSIALYNKALDSLKGGSEDIAIIELKKAISLNTHFLEAMNLLGLCYLHLNENDLATDMFQRVAKAEANGVNAIKYMESISRGSLPPETVKTEKGKSKSRKRTTRTSRTSKIEEKKKTDTVRVKKHVKANIISYAICFAAGVIIMFLIASPFMFNNPQPEPDNQTVSLEEYDAAVQKGVESENRYIALEQEYKQLQKKLEEAEETIDYYNRIKKLDEVAEKFQNDNLIEAADMLLLLNDAEFRDAEVERFNTLKEQIMLPAAERAYQEGVNLCQNSLEYESALDMLSKVELYDKDFNKRPGLLYYMGKSYQNTGQYDLAMEKYNELLLEYPNDYYVQYTHYRISEISLEQN